MSSRCVAAGALVALVWLATSARADEKAGPPAAAWTGVRRQQLLDAVSRNDVRTVREMLDPVLASRARTDAESAILSEAVERALFGSKSFPVAVYLLEHGVRCTDRGGAALRMATEHSPKGLAVCLRQDERLQERVAAGPDERFPHEKLLGEWVVRFAKSTGEVGMQPLIVAASHGDPALLRPILRHIAVDAATESGWTPLMEAASEGRDEAVRLLLSHGAAIDRRGADGVTALVVAARYGHEKTVRLLLERKAGPVEAALSQAIERGHAPVVRVLLERRAITDVNLGEPLAAAVDRELSDATELLLAAGAPVGQALPLACRSKPLGTVRRLRQARTFWTDDLACLVAAARAGNVATIREVGSSLKAPGAVARRGLAKALEAALQSDQVQAVEALLQLGAPARPQSPDETPPLMRAASVPALRLLLARGAEANDRTKWMSAIDWFADEARHEPLLLALLDAGLKVDVQQLLCRASEKGMPTVARRMLEKGASWQLPSCGEGRTALETAWNHNRWSVVGLMLERGAPLGVEETLRAVREQLDACERSFATCDGEWLKLLLGKLPAREARVRWKIDGAPAGGTLLFPVARTAFVGAALALLARGADVDARADDGSTALMVAATAGQADMVRALAKAGADLAAVDGDGNSALHRAACDEAVVRLLVELKANVNLDAGKGTPLDRATSRSCRGTAALLEAAGAKRSTGARRGGSRRTREGGR